MTAPRASLAPLLLLAALAGACAHPNASPAVLVQTDHESVLNDRAFGAHRRILSGFAAESRTVGLLRGDQALYGILVEKQGVEQVWFVRVEVIATDVSPGTRVRLPPSELRAESVGEPADGDPAESDSWSRPAPDWSRLAAAAERRRGVRIEPTSLLVRMHVFDRQARLLASTHEFVPQSVLRSGFCRICELHRSRNEAGGQPRALTAAETQEVYEGAFALFLIGKLLWRAPVVGKIFDEVVPRPSILSIVLNLGFRVNFSPKFDQVVREERRLPPLSDAERAAVRVPIEIGVNNETLMRFELIAAPPVPPLRLCTGILGAEGANVRDPDHRFVLRLLAARQGPLPPSPDERNVVRAGAAAAARVY